MKLIIATPASPHPCFFTKDLTDPEAQKYLGDLQMKYGTPYRLLRMDLEKVFRQLHQLGATVPSIDQAQTVPLHTLNSGFGWFRGLTTLPPPSRTIAMPLGSSSNV